MWSVGMLKSKKCLDRLGLCIRDPLSRCSLDALFKVKCSVSPKRVQDFAHLFMFLCNGIEWNTFFLLWMI